VLLVVAVHTTYLLVPSLAERVLPGGFLGVDLFFVLSGFLITALLLQEQSATGRVHFLAFYGRRILRLYPALLVLVGAHLVYTYISGLDLGAERSSLISILTYTFNWRFTFTGGEGLGHMWSLSVEEQFYLVWPLVIAFFLGVRRRVSTITVVMVIAIVVIAVHRAMLWHRGDLWLWVAIRTDTRADAILVGALLAQLWIRGRLPRRATATKTAASVAALFLILCFALVRPENAFIYLGGYTLIAVATAIVIWAAVDTFWAGNRALNVSALRAVGRVSYGLYLWHLPVFAAVARLGSEWPAAIRVAVAWPIAAAVTVASWRLVEQPCLRFKKRLEPKRAGQRLGALKLESATEPPSLSSDRNAAEDGRGGTRVDRAPIAGSSLIPTEESS